MLLNVKCTLTSNGNQVFIFTCKKEVDPNNRIDIDFILDEVLEDIGELAIHYPKEGCFATIEMRLDDDGKPIETGVFLKDFEAQKIRIKGIFLDGLYGVQNER